MTAWGALWYLPKAPETGAITVAPDRGRNRESLGAGQSWPWGSGSRPLCDSHHRLVTEQVTGGAAVHTTRTRPPARPSPRPRAFQAPRPFRTSQIPADARTVQPLPQTGGSEKTPRRGPPYGVQPAGAPPGELAASQRSLSVLRGATRTVRAVASYWEARPSGQGP